eukprot:scaffold6449_cov43-Phaeocystis_antarctica.AAC.3
MESSKPPWLSKKSVPKRLLLVVRTRAKHSGGTLGSRAGVACRKNSGSTLLLPIFIRSPVPQALSSSRGWCAAGDNGGGRRQGRPRRARLRVERLRDPRARLSGGAHRAGRRQEPRALPSGVREAAPRAEEVARQREAADQEVPRAQLRDRLERRQGADSPEALAGGPEHDRLAQAGDREGVEDGGRLTTNP